MSVRDPKTAWAIVEASRRPRSGVIELPTLIEHFGAVGSPAPRTAGIFSDALVVSGSAREIGLRVGDGMRSLLG